MYGGLAPTPPLRHHARVNAGPDALMIQYAVGRCSLGIVLVGVTARGLCAALLGDDADSLLPDLHARFSRARLEEADGSLDATVTRVEAHIEDPTVAPQLDLDLRGTGFQLRVWAALRGIPCGETRTYGDLARDLGDPRRSRAVAGACAANPVAVVVPCHRMVRGDGGLSGYRWGIERKRALLEREAALVRATWTLTPG